MTSGDHVDHIVRDWRHARPDLDVSPLEVVLRILRLARLLQSRLDAIAAGNRLSNKGDLDTLTALLRAGPPHELSPTSLARTLLMTSGGMTVRLDRLERAGFVERLASKADRRSVVVRLTAEGRALVDRVFDVNLETQRAAMAALTREERADLIDKLRRLLLALGDE